MSAPKKHTQFIFDHIYRTKDIEAYGYLGLKIEVINKLIAIRQELKLTQHALAKTSGVAQATIARLESGKANPSLDQILKIAKSLGHKISFEPAEFKVEKYVDFTDRE